MGLFEFIVLLVLIITLGEAAIKIMVPLSARLADLLGEMAAERRAVRKGEGPVRSGPAVSAAAVEELEDRLARIEERLDFIEQLGPPRHRAALESGEVGAVSGPETG